MTTKQSRVHPLDVMARAAYARVNSVENWDAGRADADLADMINADMSAALTALEAAGFAIVPREPTPRMIEAAVNTMFRENKGVEYAPSIGWRAMIKEATNA